MSVHGVEIRLIILNLTFSTHPEYQFLVNVGAEFAHLLEAGAYVARGEKKLKAGHEFQ